MNLRSKLLHIVLKVVGMEEVGTKAVVQTGECSAMRQRVLDTLATALEESRQLTDAEFDELYAGACPSCIHEVNLTLTEMSVAASKHLSTIASIKLSPVN